MKPKKKILKRFRPNPLIAFVITSQEMALIKSFAHDDKSSVAKIGRTLLRVGLDNWTWKDADRRGSVEKSPLDTGE